MLVGKKGFYPSTLPFVVYSARKSRTSTIFVFCHLPGPFPSLDTHSAPSLLATPWALKIKLIELIEQSIEVVFNSYGLGCFERLFDSIETI